MTIKDYVLKSVEARLSADVDNLNRAALQQVRMPFDHDNNDAIERYREQVMLGRIALWRVEEGRPL